MTNNPEIVVPSGSLKIEGAEPVVVVATGTADEYVEGQPDNIKRTIVPNIEIGPEQFRESFGKICKVMEEATQFGSPDRPGFYAAELEVRLELTAGGGLRILGSGLEMNATGGIRVLFKRGKEG